MLTIKSPNSNAGNSAGMSGAALGGFPHVAICMGVLPGVFCFDTFDKFEAQAADGAQNGYYVNVTATGEIELVNEVGGVISLTVGADNDAVLLISGGGEAGFCEIPATVSAREDIVFDCRVKPIDESALEFFAGLTAPIKTTVLGGSDDTLASVKMIGFHGKSDGTIDVVIKDPSGTSETTTVVTTVTQADDTWLKLSVRLSTNSASSGRLEFFINGTSVATYSDITGVANGIPNSVPQDTPLCAVIDARAAGAASALEVDHLAYGTEACN